MLKRYLLQIFFGVIIAMPLSILFSWLISYLPLLGNETLLHFIVCGLVNFGFASWISDWTIALTEKVLGDGEEERKVRVFQEVRIVEEEFREETTEERLADFDRRLRGGR